jgi:xanthine dehydrogenase accessory factor
MNNIYSFITNTETGSSPVIATVIETWGSTPQKPGSSALFDSNGLLAGTVGGGVLEGKVCEIAIKSAERRESGIYNFDLDHEIFFTKEAICGGHASVLIDASPDKKVFNLARNSLTQRIPGILVTIVKGKANTNISINRYWITSVKNNNLPSPYYDILKGDLENLFSSSGQDIFRKKDLVNDRIEDNARIFFEALFPPSKLIIAGAGHIGRALAHLGKLLDFEVTVIDDRAEYANKQNIPDGDYFIVDDIGTAIAKLDKQSDTYIVIVTRGHNDDAKALKGCIGSSAAYIGMIGSKAKVGKMHQNFIEQGLSTEEQWSAIHTPVGIDINSQTVEEIAVSIAAQLIMVRNGKRQTANGKR